MGDIQEKYRLSFINQNCKSSIQLSIYHEHEKLIFPFLFFISFLTFICSAFSFLVQSFQLNKCAMMKLYCCFPSAFLYQMEVVFV